MFVPKLGLYEDVVIKKDLPIGRYKTYDYTERDFNVSTNESRIPCVRIQGSISFKINNGHLYIDNKDYIITRMRIIDVLLILNRYCTISILEDYEPLIYLPAYLLTNMNNVSISQFKGDHSPFNYFTRMSSSIDNNTVYKISEQLYSLNIYDTVENKEIDYKKDDYYLYYLPNNNTTVIFNSLITDFYLYIDLNSKMLVDIPNISNIIKNTEKIFNEPLPE